MSREEGYPNRVWGCCSWVLHPSFVSPILTRHSHKHPRSHPPQQPNLYFVWCVTSASALRLHPLSRLWLVGLFLGPCRGVRCRADILCGMFVCEYVGDVVTDEMGATRGLHYDNDMGRTLSLLPLIHWRLRS